MTTATTPSLGGSALPMPTRQSYSTGYRGATLEMADGSYVHDLVQDARRYTYSLYWTLLTAAEVVTIDTAYHAIRGSDATYISTENLSRTVTRPPDGKLEVEPVVTAAGDIKFNVSMELVGQPE